VDAAESAGLLEIGARVTFRHPLVRSAVYRAASPGDRREIHRALAEVTDQQLDPDRCAWHRAQAAAGPDDGVADELERSAGRALARGGPAAAAAFLERSAELTLEPGRRAERALAAAEATAQAGAFDAALRLLAAAGAGALGEVQSARADLLRGQIAFISSRGSDAPPLLLKAASHLQRLDPGLAYQTYREALAAAIYAGRLAAGGGLREAAEAAQAARPAQPLGADDLVIDGLALLITKGHAAAQPTLRRALRAAASRQPHSAPDIELLSAEQGVRWLWLGVFAAEVLWDDESWDLLSARHVQRARDAGALGVLPVALSQRAALHLLEGDFAAATSMIEEAETIGKATESQRQLAVRVALAAFRGREGEASELAQLCMKDVARRGEGAGLTFLQWATAVLGNSLGHYEEALTAAQPAAEDPRELIFSTWAAAELIEAATHCGVPELAAGALERLTDSTQASGSDWALGIEALSRAQLSEGKAAEGLYREALTHLARTRLRVPLARAHLLYGEWLRRENRRADAREQLRTAHRAPDIRRHGSGRVHGTSRTRTAGHRRASAQAHGRGPRPAHRPGNPDRPAGRRGHVQPRDHGPAVHEPAYRRIPPAQGFNKLDIKSRNQLHGVLASHGQAEMDKDPRCR